MQDGLAWKLPVDNRPCDLADLTPIRFNTKTRNQLSCADQLDQALEPDRRRLAPELKPEIEESELGARCLAHTPIIQRDLATCYCSDGYADSPWSKLCNDLCHRSSSELVNDQVIGTECCRSRNVLINDHVIRARFIEE